MYQEQRLEKILELLEERKQLSAKEMVDYFKVSKDTIRRDFALLSQTPAGPQNPRWAPSLKQRIRPFLPRP